MAFTGPFLAKLVFRFNFALTKTLHLPLILQLPLCLEVWFVSYARTVQVAVEFPLICGPSIKNQLTPSWVYPALLKPEPLPTKFFLTVFVQKGCVQQPQNPQTERS